MTQTEIKADKAWAASIADNHANPSAGYYLKQERDRGFLEGIQHAIHCIFQMQENYHGKMSLDSAVTRLEAELKIMTQRKK